MPGAGNPPPLALEFSRTLSYFKSSIFFVEVNPLACMR